MATGFYDLQDEFRRHAEAGELKKALESARQLWAAFPDRHNFTWIYLAAAHAAMGDFRLVAQVLRQALDTNALWRLSLLDVPELKLVHSDPECQAVIKEARKRVEAKHYQSLLGGESHPHADILPHSSRPPVSNANA